MKTNLSLLSGPGSAAGHRGAGDRGAGDHAAGDHAAGDHGAGDHDPDPDSSAFFEGLELELRNLPGVNYVGMSRQTSLLLIELGTDATGPGDVLIDEATRMAKGWLESDVEVRIIDDDVSAGNPAKTGGSLRVRLLAAVDGERVEIHLAHLGRRSSAGADSDDATAIAEATLAALRPLGFPVPFEVEAVHQLPEELGSGVLVVLVDRVGGERRRGVANGRSAAETVARAVLNGLNRYLQMVERGPDDR